MNIISLVPELISLILDNLDINSCIIFSMTSKYHNDLLYHIGYYSNIIYELTVSIESLSSKYPITRNMLELFMRYGQLVGDSVSNTFVGRDNALYVDSIRYYVIIDDNNYEILKEYVATMNLNIDYEFNNGLWISENDLDCDIVVVNDLDIIGIEQPRCNYFIYTHQQCYYKNGKIEPLPYSKCNNGVNILSSLKSRGIYFSNDISKFEEQVRYKDLLVCKTYRSHKYSYQSEYVDSLWSIQS